MVYGSWFMVASRFTVEGERCVVSSRSQFNEEEEEKVAETAADQIRIARCVEVQGLLVRRHSNPKSNTLNPEPLTQNTQASSLADPSTLNT